MHCIYHIAMKATSHACTILNTVSPKSITCMRHNLHTVMEIASHAGTRITTLSSIPHHMHATSPLHCHQSPLHACIIIATLLLTPHHIAIKSISPQTLHYHQAHITCLIHSEPLYAMLHCRFRSVCAIAQLGGAPVE